jgi:hypothetical protein
VDPVLGSIIVSFVTAIAAIGVAIITARSNADRLLREQENKRLRKKVTDLGGNPDED